MSAISPAQLDALRRWVEERSTGELFWLRLWCEQEFTDPEARHNAFRFKKLAAEELRRRRRMT